MNYLHYPLNYQQGGKTIKATISGTACNVILLDSNNFTKYRVEKNSLIMVAILIIHLY